MPLNPLGVHYIPVHISQAHYDFIQSVKPGVVKLVSGNGAPDVQMMADMYAKAPDAIHIYRNHPLSEQHEDLWRDPVGTAQLHARNWFDELSERALEAVRRGIDLPPQSQTMTLGINEPVIETFARKEDMSNYAEWLGMVMARTALLDDYMSTYATESLKYGQPCCVGNFSFGQPANRLPGEFATYRWFPKTRAVVESAGGKVGLAVHEYWDIDGPAMMANWGPYRFTHCEWNVPIFVLECGVDRAVHETHDGNRGWYDHLTPAQYAEQLYFYISTCMRDPRFMVATPFTLDGDEMWWSFWVDNCMAELVAVSDRLRQEPRPEPGSGHTIYLPTVPNDGPKTPTSELPTPQPYSPDFVRAIAWLLPIEDGYTDNDEGSPANFGINQAANPDIDVAHLTREGAVAIYYERYWQAAGCDAQDWPLNFLIFDSAVQHGVGRAGLLYQSAWSVETERDDLAFMGVRLQFYAQINEDSWQRNGKSWMRRMGLLLTEASK